jgi:hypothetical protein
VTGIRVLPLRRSSTLRQLCNCLSHVSVLKRGSSGIRVGDLGPISAAPGRHAMEVAFQVCVGPAGAGPGICQSLQSYQLRCTCPHAPARARPTGRCCDRRGRDRPWASVVAEDLPHRRSDTGILQGRRMPEQTRSSRRWHARHQVHAFCTPSRTPPAALRAGSGPLSSTFSPTRIPEEPILMGQWADQFHDALKLISEATGEDMSRFRASSAPNRPENVYEQSIS